MQIKTMTILKSTLVSSLLLIAGNAMADVQVLITGEIYNPPCEINDNNRIVVDFEKIALQKVDGSAYQKSVTVPVKCLYYAGTPYVTVSGTQLEGAPDNVLKTSSTGVNASRLGVALYQGSGIETGLVLGNGTSGRGYPITRGFTNVGEASSTFTLTAVPYKNGSGDLEAGFFSATASMSILYQ